jgi:hypothetical protein
VEEFLKGFTDVVAWQVPEKLCFLFVSLAYKLRNKIDETWPILLGIIVAKLSRSPFCFYAY